MLHICVLVSSEQSTVSVLKALLMVNGYAMVNTRGEPANRTNTRSIGLLPALTTQSPAVQTLLLWRFIRLCLWGYQLGNKYDNLHPKAALTSFVGELVLLDQGRIIT